jgi:hypothetical protein
VGPAAEGEEDAAHVGVEMKIDIKMVESRWMR